MNFITYDMFKCYKKQLRRRGRLAKRRVPEELSAPAEEHIDEYVNVPIPPPVPLEPSQAGPSRPLEPTGSEYTALLDGSNFSHSISSAP